MTAKNMVVETDEAIESQGQRRFLKGLSLSSLKTTVQQVAFEPQCFER